MIAWNNLGKMLSFYLYGTEVPTENYEDRLRERPIGNVSLEIDSVDYMVNGAGRYAYASQAQVVQDFFNVTTIIPDGSYTKEQIVELFGYPEQTSNFDNWHFAFSQSGVDSASGDYGLRSLMYNSTRFYISDDALFVVENGVRYINNMSIIPESDDFNFESGDWYGDLANFAYLMNKIDPHNIGETVHINYIGSGLQKGGSYTYQDYLSDQQNVTNQFSGPDYVRLVSEILSIVNSSELNDVLDYTTVDGGEIEYGTSYGDLLQISDKSDIVVAGSGDDVVQSYDGNDTIYGGKGNDELDGGAGNDTYLFSGEYDKDTITDSDGEGVIKINNQAITGTAYLINDGNNNLYQLTIGSEIYLLKKSGSDLVIVNNGDSYNEGGSVVNQVTVKDFNSGDLGIVLSDDVDDGSDGSFPIYYVYNGTSGRDTATSLGLLSFSNNIIYAGAGNDSISVGSYNIIYGGSGDDIISTGSNNIINAGTGNDVIYSSNNSTYIFNQGDGSDIINSSSVTISLGEGISKDDVYLVYVNNDYGSYATDYGHLIIKFKNSDTDQIYVPYHFSRLHDSLSSAKAIEFSDGSVIDLTSNNLTLHIEGTDGNNYIWQYYSDNKIVVDAGAGDDTIVTDSDADNIIEGGLGNDLIQTDGSSDDTYIFNKGDGNDTIYDYGGGIDKIKFGEGITKDDIYFTQGYDAYGAPYHVVINFWNSPGNSIVLRYYFGKNSNGYQIEYLEFSDGSVVSLASLHPENTTYEFNKGQGSYIINDSSGANQIVFGAGITKDDIHLVASGNDLLVNFASSPSDQIKITNYSVSNFVNIESLKFADGSTFSFIDFVVNITGTSGSDNLNASRSNNYIINAGAGDDTLNISSVPSSNNVTADMGDGDDIVNIYTGNNDVYGGDGNDSFYISESSYLGKNVIDAGNGDDYIYSYVSDGYVGSSTIDGGDGNDYIYSGSGDDTLFGGAGNDSICGGSGNNTLTGGAGSDTFIIGYDSVSDTVTDFDLVNDKIDISDLGLNKYFSDLNIYQDGANVVVEVSDKKIILENVDASSLSASNFYGVLKDGGYAINGTNHDDVFDGDYSIYGAMENDSYVINGYGGDDYIADSDGTKDVLDGGEGNDTLVARYNEATLIGGAGSDKFVFSFFQSYYYDAVTNVITDFDINDPNEKIILDGALVSRFSELEITDTDEGAVITYDTGSYWGYYTIANTILLKGVLASQLSASNFQIGTTINGTEADEVFDYSSAENGYYISGYGGNDQVYTGFGDDYVYVSSGDDIVNGGAGNDEIYSYGGNDVVYGGQGDDYISSQYGSSGEVVKIYAEEGDDHIYVNYTSAKQEISVGEGNDLIDLNASSSLINGDAGNDIIDLISGGSNDVNGGDVNDIINIYGGASGNDISGGEGNDIFVIRPDQYSNSLSGNYNYINDFDINNPNEKIDFQFLNIQFEDLDGYQDGDYAFIYYNLDNGLGGGGLYLKNVDILQLTANNFIFKNNGTVGDDVIEASNKYNVVDGGDGDDEITIAAIDGDYNSNSPLESYITGGAGIDTFIINKTANSKIEIFDFDSSLGEKIKLNDFTNITSFSDLYIRYVSNGDAYDAEVTLEDGQILTIKNIENNSLTTSDFEFTKSNYAPTIGSVIANQEARVVNFFSFTIPADAFVDVNGDNLTYDVTLADGSALPSYLTFNQETKTLSGRIQGYLLGQVISLKVVASDGELSVSQNFDIDVVTNVIKGTDESDNISGTSYDDIIYTYKGDDVIYGDGGNDVINGNEGEDFIDGGAGDDNISGGLGRDVIYCGVGNDVVNAGGDDDIVYGGDGNDNIDGVLGNDVLYGGVGDDYLFGNIGDDILYGDDGNDILSGGQGNDIIDGGAGDDDIGGGVGDDNLSGGDGNDVMRGAKGNDVITGGIGADYLTGGEGSDTFTFTSLDDSTVGAYDVISDFKSGEDLIDLSGLGFSNIVNGSNTGDASTLSYHFENDQTIIQNVNHTFQITLSGKINLSDGDFDFS